MMAMGARTDAGRTGAVRKQLACGVHVVQDGVKDISARSQRVPLET